MGIEDRDYCREDYAKKHGMRYDAKLVRYFSKLFRRDRFRSSIPDSGPPELPGANWHWATKVLFWLALVAVLFVVFRVVERKQIEAKRQKVDEANTQIQRARQAQPEKPTVDFFK